MIGWAMHHLATRWCVVVEKHASIVTACRGRWSATDNYEIAKGDPQVADRCVACEAVRLEAEEDNAAAIGPAAFVGSIDELAALIATPPSVEAGLDELRAATPLVDVGPRFEFDMSEDA